MSVVFQACLIFTSRPENKHTDRHTYIHTHTHNTYTHTHAHTHTHTHTHTRAHSKKIAREKHSSFFASASVTKSFITLTPRACAIKLYITSIHSVCNKLECLSLSIASTLRARPELTQVTPTQRGELAYKYWLYWKRLRVTNTLAYYGVVLVTAIKRFVIQVPGACTIKLFTAVIVAVL